VWPSVTLCLGVLAGVTVLAEEQTRGVARFWAERRLPLGRFWLVKIACHFGIASLAALIVFIPLFAASPNLLFRSRLWSQSDFGLRGEIVRFLWIGLVYGFVFGHLAGMMFRKTIVSGLVAAVTSATFVAAIAPSILGGGAASWQVWAPAAILLLTARMLLYPWATERVLGTGPVLRLTSGVSIAILVLTAGIAYRVYEIPDVPDRLVESGFEANLPPFDAKDAGRSLRSATAQYRKAADDAKELYPVQERAGLEGALVNRPPGLGDEQDPLEKIVSSGWSSDSNRLKPWLDQVFADEWTTVLFDLADKPVGVFEDPRDLDYFTSETNRRDLRDMLFAVRARCAQRQAEDDAKTLVKLLPGALAACRSARNKAGWRTPEISLHAEELLFDGIDDWLTDLKGQSELVRAVLEIVANHARQMPTDMEDIFWADRVILRNTMQRIGTWLPAQIAQRSQSQRTITTQVDAQAEAQAELVAVAWNVPWERVRRERIQRVHTHADKRVEVSWLSGLHLRNMWGQNRYTRQEQREVRALTLRRLVQIQLAARLVQLETTKPLRHLDQLLPYVGRDVLEDPYTKQSFGYRLTTAESIEADAINKRDWTSGESMWIRVAMALGYSDGWRNAIYHMSAFANTQSSSPMRIGMSSTFSGASNPVRSITLVPGASIIWSGGPDKRDDGGRRTPPRGVAPGPGQDWIVVVRPPDERRK
jgi:hypothetical protein